MLVISCITEPENGSFLWTSDAVTLNGKDIGEQGAVQDLPSHTIEVAADYFTHT